MLKSIRLAGVWAVIVALALVSEVGAESKTNRSAKSKDSKLYDQFMPKVLEMNAEEADLGWLGAQKAQNPRVREFARMVAETHYETLENLGGLHHIPRTKYTGVPKDNTYEVTRSKPYPDPNRNDYTDALSRDYQQVKARLNRLSGAEFDREFMKVMVERHRKGVDFYRTHLEAFSTAPKGDPAVNAAFADLSRQMLPVVQDHLSMALAIQRELPVTNQ